MPPLLNPMPCWKPIFYSFLFSFIFIGTSLANPHSGSFNDFQKEIESGKELLKERKGAAARINFKNAWDNTAYTDEQRSIAQQLYYKAKNLEPYFSLLEEAEVYINSKDYKTAVDLLKRSEKHLYSSSTRFPDEGLDNFFTKELADKINSTEAVRLEMVDLAMRKIRLNEESNPEVALKLLEEIKPQLLDTELAQYKVSYRIEDLKTTNSYESYLEQGQAAIEAKDYPRAKELLMKGWKINATQDIYQLILQVDEMMCMSIFEKSKREMELKNYEYALDLLEESASCAPQDEQEQLQRTAMDALYEEYLVQGSRALEAENFQVAWSTLKKAKRNKTTSEVDALITKAERGAKYENYFQIALDYENSGEWQEALGVYQQALEQLKKPGVEEKITQVQDVLDKTNEKIKLAEDAMKDEKWELARTHLLAGQRIYPKNAKIKKLLTEIDENQKVLDEDSE